MYGIVTDSETLPFIKQNFGSCAVLESREICRQQTKLEARSTVAVTSLPGKVNCTELLVVQLSERPLCVNWLLLVLFDLHF